MLLLSVLALSLQAQIPPVPRIDSPVDTRPVWIDEDRMEGSHDPFKFYYAGGSIVLERGRLRVRVRNDLLRFGLLNLPILRQVELDCRARRYRILSRNENDWPFRRHQIRSTPYARFRPVAETEFAVLADRLCPGAASSPG